MLTDPRAVARRAAALQDENHRFGVFLRHGCKWPRGRLIRVAAALGRAAAARIDCLQCGNCCRAGNLVPVSRLEAAALAMHVGLPILQRAGRAGTQSPDLALTLDADPCPFQAGNACTVYDQRPRACRDYPFLDADPRARFPEIVERSRDCPIVFEQLERLKDATGFRRIFPAAPPMSAPA